MKKKTIVLVCAAIGIGLGSCEAIQNLRRGRVFPVDETTARQEFLRSLARQGLRVPPERIEAIPTRGTWLGNLWVFGVRNPKWELVGGPVYNGMFLVGPMVAGRQDAVTQSRYVTCDFVDAFQRQINPNPPTTAENALKIAKSFAWLSMRSHPDRLQVLQRGEVPADLLVWLRRTRPELVQTIAEQIVGPSVSVNQVAPKGETVFTVELCTQSKDFWGDIYFWHMEIGRHVFSVSQRPIYKAPRGLA